MLLVGRYIDGLEEDKKINNMIDAQRTMLDIIQAKLHEKLDVIFLQP